MLAIVKLLLPMLKQFGICVLIFRLKAVGFQVIPKRWVVERTFAWLFNSRRLAKDFEKTITRGYD